MIYLAELHLASQESFIVCLVIEEIITVNTAKSKWDDFKLSVSSKYIIMWKSQWMQTTECIVFYFYFILQPPKTSGLQMKEGF